MEWWQLVVLAGAGGVAGFVNVMAGGGSLLTMPVMIFLGMTPATANGTNRIALLIQNIIAVDEFRRKGFADVRRSSTLALCTFPGAVAGAIVAVQFDPLWFKRLLAVVMVLVMIHTLRGRRTSTDGSDEERSHPVLAHLTMLGIGFYGGFIQAGVGFLIIASLQGLLLLDLVRVNMHKVFIIGCYMVPSLIVFAINGNVQWLAGLVLAVGNAAGAWVAVRLAVSKGERVIRVVFALAIVAMAIRLAIG